MSQAVNTPAPRSTNARREALIRRGQDAGAAINAEINPPQPPAQAQPVMTVQPAVAPVETPVQAQPPVAAPAPVTAPTAAPAAPAPAQAYTSEPLFDTANKYRAEQQAEQEKLRAERKALEDEIAKLRAQNAAQAEALSKSTAAERDAEFQRLLNLEGYEFTSTDPEDLKKVMPKLATMIEERTGDRLSGIEEKFSAREEALRKELAAVREEQQMQQLSQINRALCTELGVTEKQINDLKLNPEWVQLMASGFGGTNLSTGDVLMTEYKGANVPFVAEIMRPFFEAAAKPSIEDVAGVSPTSMGGTGVAQSENEMDAWDERAALMQDYKSRKISLAEFREKSEKLREKYGQKQPI